MSDIKFVVNEEKKIVICKLENCKEIACNRLLKYAPSIFYSWDLCKIPDVFSGVARCAPEDEFDVEYGKKLALIRAKRKRGQAINKSLRKAVRMMEREIMDIKKYGIHHIPDLPWDEE